MFYCMFYFTCDRPFTGKDEVDLSLTHSHTVGPTSQFNLSVESNQNVESKRKNVESRNEKCGVQNVAKSQRNDDDGRVPYTFRSKGDVYTNAPHPTFGPNICIVCSSSLIFSKIFSLARLHVIAEIRNSGMQLRGVLYI